MPDLIFLITNPTSLELPSSFLGWLGWILFLSLIVLLNYRWREFNKSLDTWHRRAFVFLLISVPLTTLILPSLQNQTQFSASYFPILAAVPMFVTAGLLGPGFAATIGFLSGLFMAVWGNHNLGLPLELAFLSTLLGWMFLQEYRTPFFRGVRHPILASVILILVYPLIHLIGMIILGSGSLIVRLNYGINEFFSTTISFGMVILVAGIIVEIFARSTRAYWGSKRNSVPSPGESKLTHRFLFTVVPLSIVLLTLLIIGTWYVAGNAARQMLEGRMANAAELAAQGIPFFLETGQNLLLSLAEDQMLDQAGSELQEWLAIKRRDTLYFSQLIYLDPVGNLIASDPINAIDLYPLTQKEIDLVEAASLIPFDETSIEPDIGGATGIRSFVVAVHNEGGELSGILIGRSDLSVTPFAKPILTSVGSLSDIEGRGMIVDEDGLILYHPNSNLIMTRYTGTAETESHFFASENPGLESELVFYRPIEGKSWSVIISVPSRFAQQQAINIALPLLGIITILSIAAIFIIRFGLQSLTSSLKDLSLQADRMSKGELNDPLPPGGEDEIGQLRRAFDQMRASLKSRLDESNRLLLVTQGIASTFDLEEALIPVLESALLIGGSAARIYLIPSLIPNTSGDTQGAYRIGSGPESESYSFMDEQVSGFAKKQNILKLNNLTRPRIFTHPQESSPPQALLAVAIRHEKQYYGTLWLAFEQPHQFTDEEVGYIATLAGHAAIAAANAKLFLTSEIGRQRLESILVSTPDPVLVTDHNDNLLLANPAAQGAFGIYDETYVGLRISEVVDHAEVLALLQSDEKRQQTMEIEFKDGKTYYATASPVDVEGKGVGRVCVLRDVTSFKQLDASKTDFVSTVSHDLRSPIAMIQGYTSMLQMVGDLNNQQSSYLNKIILETEKISHLVTNLLDLGRIEAGVGLQLEKKPVDDVIKQVISASQLRADQKRVKLKSNIPHIDLPLIEADQDLLQQALYNLVDNAIKFTDNGGEILLGLELEEESVIYKVKDSGVGISPADQLKLFGKFFRISSKGSIDEDGSGLGLAIVKSVAERHGGEVGVESQLGAGSKFILKVPLRQAKSENLLVRN
jgi:PAS domain S-box-containing protein